jgi:hypothetical protein
MPPKIDTLCPSADRLVAVDPPSLYRFTATAPHVRRLLEASGGCDRELLLRSAMRRALRELAEVFSGAAEIEADPLRAEQLRVASRVATELALTAPQ